MVEKCTAYSANNSRAKAITYCVAEMIYTDLQPFSIVSDVGFEHLLAELELRYVLPSRRQFSEVHIPEIFTKVKQGISELLSLVSCITLTTDIWSSTNCSHSFLSLTAHFNVESRMEKKDVMLCAWKFDELHTGVNIAAAILSHVHQWEVEDKIVCFTRQCLQYGSCKEFCKSQIIAMLGTLSPINHQGWCFTATCSAAVISHC